MGWPTTAYLVLASDALCVLVEQYFASLQLVCKQSKGTPHPVHRRQMSESHLHLVTHKPDPSTGSSNFPSVCTAGATTASSWEDYTSWRPVESGRS